MPPSKKKEIETFECSICCADDLPTTIRNKPNRIQCPGCLGIFCVDCQRNYAKGDCMNCHLEFKQRFIVEHLGKAFIDKVLKPKLVEELMKEQKETLKYVQPMVDWERELRKQRKNARFGVPISIPERPSISIRSDKTFPCPINNCRGFVSGGECGVCHMPICMKCREKCVKNHICNQDTLMTISKLMADTKPCPRCCADIHRTSGCNHMFCTNCRTHFDWVSGKILKNSTNGHYLHLAQFAQNVATREEAVAHQECEAGFSIHRDKVALDEIDRTVVPDSLVQCLWIDSNSIRLAKKRLYNEETIDQQYTETLQELQVKYLLNDIDEANWSKNVYQTFKRHSFHKLYGQVFSIYLEMTDGLQLAVRYRPSDFANIANEYRKLVELCNESFNSIHEEFGGVLHKFRNYDDDLLVAPFI